MNYESNWPIYGVVNHHFVKVREMEASFRAVNGSTTTLPDFHQELVDDALHYEVDAEAPAPTIPLK